MPDMKENAETQQEYFGVMTERQKKLIDEVENFHKDMQKKERARLKPYEDKIADLEEKLANADYQLEGRDNEIAELKKACDETQELLDKQIEATFKLDKENAKAKEIIREFTLGFDTQGQYDRLQAKAEAFLNSEV